MEFSKRYSTAQQVIQNNKNYYRLFEYHVFVQSYINKVHEYFLLV